jgi:1,4-alpha-glucan branching enzyme
LASRKTAGSPLPGQLGESDIQALLGARHADPFAVLGWHVASDGSAWVRALLPGACEVAVVEARYGAKLAQLTLRHPDGLFEGCVDTSGGSAKFAAPKTAVAKTSARQDYRFDVAWHDGERSVLADAYAFGAQIDDADLHALREGRHVRPYTVLGAHLQEVAGVAGVRFAVWAPNARRVSVIGDFNQWDGRRHVMRLRHDAGTWEIFIPHVEAGAYYKYELVGPDGTLLPLKADPYAFSADLRPNTASRVAALPAPRQLDAARARANHRAAPISIYEVHLASWREGSKGRYPQWDELAEQLPAYAADLGFTHIELLPISEYPFDGSWGYQTLGLYAPTARFGDPAGFARFVEACHARGIGLLLDWVPAHFPSDAHGMSQFDGTALYEYADPREGFHRDWNTLIYNFGRNEVRNFLTGNALYWLERFGVDGLRVDAVASMLYRDYSRPSGEWIPNAHGGRENLEAIDLLKRMNEIVGTHAPGAMTVAEESTAFPGVSAPTYAGGLGFHFKWNMGWMHDTLQYIQEKPVHRRWHHDKLTFGLLYAFSENFVLPISHDEVVHGKGSMLAKMPGDPHDPQQWQRFANLRAYYGFMWGHPGKKLLFMGQEFAQHDEWNHDRALPWHLLQYERHAGMQHLVRDLNGLYRSVPALHERDCEASGFEWIVDRDADQSVFAWLRRDASGGCAIVVCNFTPVPRLGYVIGVPETAGPGAAAWREVLNTDSHHYGGSNLGNGDVHLPVRAGPSHGRTHSITLDLPPLATVFLTPA